MLVLESFTTSQKVGNFFKGGVRGAKIFGKTIVASVVTPFRLVAATARLAGKAINAAMRAGIILGVITVLYSAPLLMASLHQFTAIILILAFVNLFFNTYFPVREKITV